MPDLQARSEYLKIQMDYERSAAKLARGDPSRIGRTPTRTAALPPAGEGLDLMQLQVRPALVRRKLLTAMDDVASPSCGIRATAVQRVRCNILAAWCNVQRTAGSAPA